MIPDSLIRKFVHAINSGHLNFSDSTAAVPLPAADRNKQYLLYLHIPFCVVLCPFCSFHRVQFKKDRAEQYFSALREEIRNATAAGFRFNEVYIGGGTPTVLPAELIDTVRLIRDLHPVGQISVETNPDDIDDVRVPLLRDVGVNRLSVGVQSFDDQLLREMHRYDQYGSGQIISERLIQIRGEFDTLNVDMIFNFPHQTTTSLLNDLHVLTNEVSADQVSFYPLMTANSTARSMQRELGDINYRREKELYQLIVRHMRNAGYRRSSGWCFSRDRNVIDEYIVERDEYLGLGSGAFSYLDGSLYASTFSINHYLHLVEDGTTGIVRQKTMNRIDQMRYYLLMRFFSGSLDLDAAEYRFDGEFRRALRNELAGLKLIGAIRKDGMQLHLTERGYYLWVVMMREFFAGVNNLRDDMRLNISEERSILAEH